MSKHTQGEWRVVTNKHIDPDNDDVFVESDEALNDDFAIAELHGCDKQDNAKLIAAAPDLLNALKILLAGLKKNQDMYSVKEKISIAEGAIKKAIE